MNIKVAAFTVSEKSSNTRIFLNCVFSNFIVNHPCEKVKEHDQEMSQ